MKNEQQPAFISLKSGDHPISHGLTKLEKAAISAMNGILSGIDTSDHQSKYIVNDGYICTELVAEDAVTLARSLFAKLDKVKEDGK